MKQKIEAFKRGTETDRQTTWLPGIALVLFGMAHASVGAADGLADVDQRYRVWGEILEQREPMLEDTDYFWSATSWAEFEAKARELAEQSLRLVDVEIYLVDGEAHYAGNWRLGRGGFALWTCPTWDNFSKRWHVMVMNGLELVDLEEYSYRGEIWYFGLFREDTGGDLFNGANI